MSDAFDVPGSTRMRHLALPSMASAPIAGIRLAIMAAWGCVVLVEWFGSNEGAGFPRPLLVPVGGQLQRADGLGNSRAGGGDIVDRGIIERIDQKVHAGAGRSATSVPPRASRWTR